MYTITFSLAKAWILWKPSVAGDKFDNEKADENQ